MPGLHDLGREYEARRFPPGRRLDLHGEGPAAAGERALRWLQSHAHEEPGAEVLLILERGRGAHGRRSGVRAAVESVLDRLTGRLIEWWQPFTPGTVAVRLAESPDMKQAGPTRPRELPLDGRDARTAGALTLAAAEDIPRELIPLARMATELRRSREGLPTGAAEVLLGGIWIEAQAEAMSERISFDEALRRLLQRERSLAIDED
jgi:hypothetical protein